MSLEFATLDDGCTTLSDAELSAFAESLQGDTVRPGDPDYEDCRQVWNGLITLRPSLIVRCAATADVVAAVKFATSRRLRVSVRGGGHNVAGKSLCEGGMVIDLGPMHAVRIAQDKLSVRVQGGARLGDVDAATRPLGMAVPVGVVSRTGIAGLTLHGGMGWLLRRDGLTIDNLLGVELVTADGQVIQANSSEHADLFWALRGGGGNFGVVTAFEYRLRPVGERIWFAAVLYPFEKARQAIAFWRDFMADAPEELSSFCVLRGRSQFGDGVRDGRQPVVAFLACYSGPFEQGEEAIRPLREWGEPVADFSGPADFHLSLQQRFDHDYPQGRSYYWDSLFFNALDTASIDTIVTHAGSSASHLSSVNLWALGGAMNRVPPEATAFEKRDCGFMMAVEANWDEADAADGNIAWATGLIEAMRPVSRAGVYLNFPGAAAGQEGLVKASYSENFARLRQIKRRYDPDNVWRGSFNIRP